MRILGDVVVTHRGPSLHGVRANGKPAAAQLSLGKKRLKANSQPEVLLQLQVVHNKAVTMYRVEGNVEKVFTRLAGEGKATVRLREPPHDLLLSKVGVIELKAFLLALSRVLKGDPGALKDSTLTDLQKPRSVTRLDKPVTSLVVTQRLDYPFGSLPRTLTKLEIDGVVLERLDKKYPKKFMTLKSLAVLNVVNASLTKIPEELGLLPKLQTLVLSGNKIASVPRDLLRFGEWKATLTSLDLADNQIEKIPEEIVYLQNLQCLNVSQNRLKRLPLNLERLRQLSTADLSGNPLQTLPVCLSRLRQGSSVSLSAKFGTLFSGEVRPETLLDAVNQRPAPLVDQCLGRIAAAFGPKQVSRMLHPSRVPWTVADIFESRLRCCVCFKWAFQAREVRRVGFSLARIGGLSIDGPCSTLTVPGEAVVGPCGHAIIPSFL